MSKKQETAGTVAATQAIVPSEILIRHGNDPVTERQLGVENEQLKTAKAVMYLDKMEQEAIVKAEAPKLEEATKAVNAARKKLEKMAEKIVGSMKVSTEFAGVKKALQAIKINGLACSIKYTGLDLDAKKINFTRTVGDKTDRGYSSNEMTGEDTIKFTAEMKDMYKSLKAAEDEVKRSEMAILDAKHTLRDRANRMSDVEGAIAIKHMDADAQKEAKAVYDHLKGGMSVTKLLSGK